jgi:hypothetical protein
VLCVLCALCSVLSALCAVCCVLCCVCCSDETEDELQALRVFADGDNYPILVHCIHGKDRTGLHLQSPQLVSD